MTQGNGGCRTKHRPSCGRDRLVESHYSSSRSYSKFNEGGGIGGGGGTRSPQSTLEKYDNYVDMDPDGMDWSEFTPI
jgi:hypothetical protein